MKSGYEIELSWQSTCLAWTRSWGQSSAHKVLYTIVALISGDIWKDKDLKVILSYIMSWRLA